MGEGDRALGGRALLVTGGAGFIGANFVHYWLNSHPEDRVIVLDALTYAGNYENIRACESHAAFSFVHGNICDTELVKQLLTEERIGVLVHFAAESHVDRSIAGPDAFVETNILGTYSLLKAARAVWLDGPQGFIPHRFHHVSTDEVYGALTPEDAAFAETTPYAPNSPYSASKAASDHLVRAYHHTYGLQVTTSNCSNNYGPFHFPEKLIPLVITNILRNLPLPVYGDGMQVRDWLYVADHVRGIELVLEKGRIGESYNIGGNNEWRNIDIVQLICQLVNEAFAIRPELASHFPAAEAARVGATERLITYVADRPGHDRRYAIDARKAERELGFQPMESFETGIRKTLSWYLDNPAWWQQILSGEYRRYC